MTIKIINLLSTLVLTIMITGCAGKKEVAEPSEPVADITRPPQMASVKPKAAADENDAQETISYDEWRKRRQEELDNEKP